MDTYIDLYINHMKQEGSKAKNTLDAYRRDIREFHRHLRENGVNDVSEITNADVVSFMMKLKADGRTGSTVNRKMASVRSYSAYLCSEGVLKENPSSDIKPPHIERRNLDFLSIEEVESILAAPDDTVKGLRDRAILEMMYGTGIRVTEITELRMSDVNFRIGFITCSGEFGKARIIPLGRPCRKALEDYIDLSRNHLIEKHHAEVRAQELKEIKGSMAGLKKYASDGDKVVMNVDSIIEKAAGETVIDDPYLFVNYHGEKLTRQGLWKIVRNYAEKAGIDRKITPQVLRNSFAAHMVQNGADLKSIQELMGYEDITTAQIYLSVKKNRIKEVFDRTHPRA